MTNYHLQRKLLLFSAALLFALVGNIVAVSAAESVAYYRNIFDTEYQNNRSAIDGMAASNWGETYYTFQYPFAATLSMYEATKDTLYLERALSWAETMVSKATIIDTAGKKNWAGDYTSNPYTNPSSIGITYMLHDLQGTTELARLARIILTDASLRNAYGARANTIFAFERDQIVNKWLFTRGSLAWFKNNVRQTANPMSDKTAMVLRILSDMKLASAALGGTDNQTYDYPAILEDLSQGFKDHVGGAERFEAYQGGLIWDKGLSEEGYSSMDTAHANRYPFTLMDLYEAGTVFTKDYVTGVANLLSKVIWNQSLADPMFTNFIDGSNGTYLTRPAWNNGMIYHGWVGLAKYDPKVLEIMDATLKAIVSGLNNPSLDYNRTIYGRIALSGHLAKAVAQATITSPTPSPSACNGVICVDTGACFNSLSTCNASCLSLAGPGTCVTVPPPSTAPSPTPQGCQNPSPIPSGFSAPCPAFGVSPASGSATQNFTASIKPDPTKTVWIYKSLYITEGSSWKSITLPGTIQYTYWLTGNITYTLAPLPLTLSPGVHYLASWDWTWDAANQCYKGPGATACGGGQYRIQTITIQ